jgi:hypothetical protein
VLVEAMETSENETTGAACSRSTRVGSFQHGELTSRLMGNGPERKQRPQHFLLGSARAEELAQSVFGTLLTFRNRRMRTRMYGGVRRRGLVTPSYSIPFGADYAGPYHK